jgi:hypothetical protein
MARAPLPCRFAALLGAAVGLLAGAPARAQPLELSPMISPQQPPVLEIEPPPELPPRPRMSLAIGMGASFDATGFPNGTHAIPAFFATGGFGDGLCGFELGAFASSASGRYQMMVGYTPIDRLGLDAFGVVRPAARVRPDDTGYGSRVLHTLALEAGLGYERDGHTNGAGSRIQIHVGARVELPLTGAGQASELRLRLGYRRAMGLYTPQVLGLEINDSNEVYAALAVVF